MLSDKRMASIMGAIGCLGMATVNLSKGIDVETLFNTNQTWIWFVFAAMWSYWTIKLIMEACSE